MWSEKNHKRGSYDQTVTQIANVIASLIPHLRSLPQPVIAAVNGAAVGIGVTMQLAMDIRIASEAARFGFVFSRRGIVPEAASSWFLPRIVGIAQALEWCYTGRVFPAQEALAAGLPVIASNLVGASNDLVDQQGTGLRFVADSVDELASHLRRLLSNPLERSEMSARAREVVLSTGAPAYNDGTTRSRDYSPCKLNMPPGVTLCRTVSATPPLLRPYRPSSISMNSLPSCHRVDTVAIDDHITMPTQDRRKNSVSRAHVA
jgi:enoyl-CoA hydratase/carnithine racemase